MENIDIEDFCLFYKEMYHIGADRRYSKRELWKIKAYCYAVIKVFGFSISKAAQAIHKDHTTLMYHMRRSNEANERDGTLLANAYKYVKSKENKNAKPRLYSRI